LKIRHLGHLRHPPGRKPVTENRTRKEIKRLWHRSRRDPDFRRLLLAVLFVLAWTDSTPRDRLAARAEKRMEAPLT
jgi:hypothetical protein